MKYNKITFSDKLLQIKVRFIRADKPFLNLAKLNQLWIVVTLFRLIWHQTKFRLVANQLGKWNLNPTMVWFSKIDNGLLCVQLLQAINEDSLFMIVYWLFNCLVMKINCCKNSAWPGSPSADMWISFHIQRTNWIFFMQIYFA